MWCAYEPQPGMRAAHPSCGALGRRLGRRRRRGPGRRRLDHWWRRWWPARSSSPGSAEHLSRLRRASGSRCGCSRWGPARSALGAAVLTAALALAHAGRMQACWTQEHGGQLPGLLAAAGHARGPGGAGWVRPHAGHGGLRAGWRRQALPVVRVDLLARLRGVLCSAAAAGGHGPARAARGGRLATDAGCTCQAGLGWSALQTAGTAGLQATCSRAHARQGALAALVTASGRDCRRPHL